MSSCDVVCIKTIVVFNVSKWLYVQWLVSVAAANEYPLGGQRQIAMSVIVFRRVEGEIHQTQLDS